MLLRQLLRQLLLLLLLLLLLQRQHQRKHQRQHQLLLMLLVLQAFQVQVAARTVWKQQKHQMPSCRRGWLHGQASSRTTSKRRMEPAALLAPTSRCRQKQRHRVDLWLPRQLGQSQLKNRVLPLLPLESADLPLSGKR